MERLQKSKWKDLVYFCGMPVDGCELEPTELKSLRSRVDYDLMEGFVQT